MTDVATPRFLTDMAMLASAPWESTTEEELAVDLRLGDLAKTSELMDATLDESTYAIRFTEQWSGFTVLNVVVAIMPPNGTGVVIRHYRIRSQEKLWIE